MVDTDNTQVTTAKAGVSGITSLRKPETLSKLFNQGAAMEKIQGNARFLAQKS